MAAQTRNSGFRRNLVEGEILERAAELFAERGYAATSLQEIAADLGMSRSSLYHYFENKEEMLIRLVSDLVVSGEVALREIRTNEGADRAERMRSAVESLVGNIIDAPGRYRLLLTVEAELPAAIERRRRRATRDLRDELAALIRGGVRDGRFRLVDDELASLSILGMCDSVAWWPGSGLVDAEAVRRTVGDLAVASLTAPSDEQPDGSPEAAIRAARAQLDRLESLMGGS